MQFDQFTAQGNTSASLGNIPMDTGEGFTAMAKSLSTMGDTLGKMAQSAAVKAAALQGQQDAMKAVGTPTYEAVDDPEKGSTLATGGSGNQTTAPSQREQAANAFFLKAGWSPVAAAALTARIRQESSFKTTAINDADPGGSFGLGQWNGDRKQALFDFAKAQGTAPTDFGTQLAFMHQELTGSESAAGTALRGAKTVEDAANAVMGYERPQGWTADNPQGGLGYQSTLANAQRIYGAGVPTAPAIGALEPNKTPDVLNTTLQVKVPDPLPLQLRTGGTATDDAYNAAVAQTAGWKLKAGLNAEMVQAYDQNKDDPKAFADALGTISQKYTKAAQGYGPEVGSTIAQEIVAKSQTLVQSMNAKAEQDADAQRKTNASAAIQAEGAMLERQAYAVGAAPDGDKTLGVLSAQALKSIDAAQESGALQPAEAQTAKQNVLSALATSRVRGVFDALSDPNAKQAFANGLMDEWKTGKSAIAQLSLSQIEALSNGLKQQADTALRNGQADSAFNRARFERFVNDDVAQIKATGQPAQIGGQAVDFNTVAQHLGVKAALDWQEQRQQAGLTYNATNGLERMNADDLHARIAALQPKAGDDDFAMHQTAFAAALKKGADILDQRASDPGAAAEAAYPNIAQEKDPAMRAQMRMDAQKALGIDPSARLPLTNAEAQPFVDRVMMAQQTPQQLPEMLKDVEGDIQNTYGAHAEDAMVQVLRQHGVVKSTAAQGYALMKQLNLGQPVPDAEVRRFSATRNADNAAEAMNGAGSMQDWRQQLIGMNQPPAWDMTKLGAGDGSDKAAKRLPQATDINALRNDPQGTAPQFDKQFGKGRAALYLSKPDEQPIRSALPDGSIRNEYPNGYVETLAPDGSVSGNLQPRGK